MPLSPDGRVQGMWKKLNSKNQLNDIHHCDFPFYKWRRIAENLEAWKFHSSKNPKWMHNGFQLITADNLKTFSLCKFISQNTAYECMAFDKSNLNEYSEGFFIPFLHDCKSDFITSDIFYHIDLVTQERMYPKEFNIEKQCSSKLSHETDGLRFWINNIESLVNTYWNSSSNIKVHEHLMTTQIFDNCESCHLLKIPLPEYKTEWLKRPSFVKIYKNKNEILFGSVKFEVDHNGELNAILDLKKISVEQEQRLLKAFSIKSVPFRIVFHRRNSNGLFLGEDIQDPLEDEQIDVLASFESHICQNGRLCGHVLKYGQRMRDPLCDTLEPGLSYVGYHDPISGVPVGPTFILLIGGSLIYNPQGKFPGDILFFMFNR